MINAFVFWVQFLLTFLLLGGVSVHACNLPENKNVPSFENTHKFISAERTQLNFRKVHTIEPNPETDYSPSLKGLPPQSTYFKDLLKRTVPTEAQFENISVFTASFSRAHPSTAPPAFS